MHIKKGHDLLDEGENYSEMVIKTFSPEGISILLENELKSVFDQLNFLNRKSDALKASIEKLKQP